MTPAARVAAGIEILDLILDGSTAEKALTGWGRSHRFAGSKDRAAIRDHVFDALRCRSSYAWRGGAMSGRGIMIGAMRAAGILDEMFTGVGHAPPPVFDTELGKDIDTAPRDVRLDVPEWMLAHFDAALGDMADEVLAVLRARAGVFLRVNLAKGTRGDAVALLAQDQITAVPVENIKTALQVTENERRVALSQAYLTGLVELQDTSSQAAIDALEICAGTRVLDFCAGGGGKALAMAARGGAVTAHDIDPRRMVDIAPRADRAGVEIETATRGALNDAGFDLVLCDAPCSGSGTWRRTPAAKWDLTPERLTELTQMQDQVLEDACGLMTVGSTLAYATCSVFDIENSVRIQEFMARNSSYSLAAEHRWLPGPTGDGFYLAVLTRTK